MKMQNSNNLTIIRMKIQKKIVVVIIERKMYNKMEMKITIKINKMRKKVIFNHNMQNTNNNNNSN